MQNIQLTVAAIVERHGRFLLVEESVGGCEVINQPAGHVEADEALRDAVSREMLEETAWQFTPAAITGVYLWTHPENGERFLRVVFCGSCHGHDSSRELDTGIIRTLWLTEQELESRANDLRSPMVQRSIADYREGVRFPVNMFQQLDLEDLATRAAVV